MTKCSNPECTVPVPEFYTGSASKRCKDCRRREQRAYRLSPAGRASHIRHRRTAKGLASARKREARQRAKGNDKAPKQLWLKHNRVTRLTLQEMPVNTLCTNCNENLDGFGNASCSIANGSEDIRLCPVHQDFKNYGNHPLPNENNLWEDYYES